MSDERLLFYLHALRTFSGSQGSDARGGCSRRSPSCQEGRDDPTERQEPPGRVPVCAELGDPSNGNGPWPLFHQRWSIFKTVLTVPLWPLVSIIKMWKRQWIPELIPDEAAKEKDSGHAVPLHCRIILDTKSQYLLSWIQRIWFYFKKLIF